MKLPNVFKIFNASRRDAEFEELWNVYRLSKRIREILRRKVSGEEKKIAKLLRGYGIFQVFPNKDSGIVGTAELGREASVCYERLSTGTLRVFLITRDVPTEELLKYYDFEPWILPRSKKYGAFLKSGSKISANEYNLWEVIGTTLELPKDTLLVYAFNYNLALVKIAVFANEKRVLEQCVELLKRSVGFPVKVKVKSLKEQKFYRSLLPPKNPKKDACIVLPSPDIFSSLQLLPFRGMSFEMEVREIELGSYGRLPFMLRVEELYRNALILDQGMEGSNLVKLLAKELHSLGYPVIVIDLNSRVSRGLASLIDNCKYFHPLESPFSLNPFDIPEIEKNPEIVREIVKITAEILCPKEGFREALEYAISELLEKRIETPTLAHVYSVLLENSKIGPIGTYMPFLEEFVVNYHLLRLTSSNMDLDRSIENKEMLVFSLPESFHPKATALIASALLIRIYYTQLFRLKEKEYRRVFVIIDGFERLARFSETAGIIAEKLGKMAEIGLHIIVAIQNLEFNKKLLKPLLENTGLGFIFSIPKKELEKLAKYWRLNFLNLKLMPLGSSCVCVTKDGSNFYGISVTRIPEPERPVKTSDAELWIPPEFGRVFAHMSYSSLEEFPEFLTMQKILQVLLQPCYQSGIKAEELAEAVHLDYELALRLLDKMVSKGVLLKIGDLYRLGKNSIARFAECFFFEHRQSDLCRSLVRKAVDYYVRSRCCVVKVENKNMPRPDLICIPFIDLYPDFQNAFEVEIEATTAEKNPDHLIENLRKTTEFEERHIWCAEKDLPRVLEYARKWANKRTVIFAVGEGGEPNKIEVDGKIPAESGSESLASEAEKAEELREGNAEDLAECSISIDKRPITGRRTVKRVERRFFKMEKGQKKLDEVFQEFEKATQSPKEGKSGAQELGENILEFRGRKLKIVIGSKDRLLELLEKFGDSDKCRLYSKQYNKRYGIRDAPPGKYRLCIGETEFVVEIIE
jgi:hypothetical protein